MQQHQTLINGKCQFLFCDETTHDHTHYGVLLHDSDTNKLLGWLGGGWTPVEGKNSALVLSKSLAEEVVGKLSSFTCLIAELDGI